MTLTLDSQTAQRLQDELARGPHTTPADLINHALDAMSAEDHWTEEDRAKLDVFLDARMDDFKQNGGIPGSEVREYLRALRRADWQ